MLSFKRNIQLVTLIYPAVKSTYVWGTGADRNNLSVAELPTGAVGSDRPCSSAAQRSDYIFLR